MIAPIDLAALERLIAAADAMRAITKVWLKEHDGSGATCGPCIAFTDYDAARAALKDAK